MGYWTKNLVLWILRYGDFLISGAKIVQPDNFLAFDLKYFVLKNWFGRDDRF